MAASTKRLGTVLVLLTGLCGCTPHYVNEPLQVYDPQGGYRFTNLEPDEGNSDSTLVVLTFSGGGTRAAALAYGVLQGLREMQLPAGPTAAQRLLLDEVDVISSVSGGSFTALGYGLWGEDIFNNHYEERFLRHNVQGDLLLRGLNPANFLTGANRSELAVRYYDDHIFEHATYADLLARGVRPMINANATDMARQEQFNFTQRDFDILGSDLSKLPLAWAAASSSAFPVLLEPLRYKYHHGATMAAAVHHELTAAAVPIHARHRLWAQDLVTRHASGTSSLDEDHHQYLYLLDGGIIDNLGIMPFFASLHKGGIRRLTESGAIKRIVVILVDAGTAAPSDIESSGETPGSLASGVTTATSGIYTSTWVQKAVLQSMLMEIFPTVRRMSDHSGSPTGLSIPAMYTVDYYLADLNFTTLTDDEQRQRCLTMPTSFALEAEQVDELLTVGRELVSNNGEIQRLVQDLGATGD